MDLSGKTLALGIGVVAVFSGGVTALYKSSGMPVYVIEAQMTSVPDDAGMFQIIGAVSNAALVDGGIPDTGIWPDASMPDVGIADTGTHPDASQVDASVLDASAKDASAADATARPDASPSDASATFGIYQPPTPWANGPQGKILTIAPITEPAALQSVTDPTFNVSARRLLAHGSHDYSQLQAFTADNKYILLIEDTFGYSVFSYPSMALKWRLDGATGAGHGPAVQSPRVVPGLVHQVLYVTRTGAGGSSGTAVLRVFDIDTGVIKDGYTFTQPYAKGAFGQEELSEDGHWTMTYVYGGSDNKRHLIATDVVTGVKGADLIIEDMFVAGKCPGSSVDPNWIAASPQSRYAVIGWSGDGGQATPGVPHCTGIELYDLKTGAYVRHIYDGHQHGDNGVNLQGTEFFLSNIMYGPDFINFGYDGVASQIRRADWGALGHISCRSMVRGSCVIDGYALGTGQYVGYQEVYILNLDGSILRLFHHRSTASSYWVEPRTTVSPDGKIILFDTDWGTASNGGAPFAITLP